MGAWQKRVVDLMERGGVSVKEFAEVSGISKSKLYELVSRGALADLFPPRLQPGTDPSGRTRTLPGSLGRLTPGTAP